MPDAKTVLLAGLHLHHRLQRHPGLAQIEYRSRQRGKESEIADAAPNSLPAIEKLGKELRAGFPALSVDVFQWNIQQAPPPALQERLAGPVLVFERFSLPYAGVSAIDNIAPLADALLLVDDLSLTGKMASFDHIYAKIGTKFLVFEEARRSMEKHFSRVHICDAAVVQAVNSPVTTFTLAVR